MNCFDKAYKFAKKSIWKDYTTDEFIFQKADDFYKSAKNNCTCGHRFIWLTGQSGTGKTSQLLTATLPFCGKNNIKPLHIAVRNFASLYPNSKEFENSPDFREQTNGFSLKMLIIILYKAFLDGLDIILEISFLNPIFEFFVIENIQKHQYKFSLQIMAVNNLVSQALVYKRSKLTGRKTYKNSENYFYKYMEKGMRFLSKKYDFKCTIWSVSSYTPIYIGPINLSLATFLKERAKPQKISLNKETELLKTKCIFLETQYQDAFF